MKDSLRYLLNLFYQVKIEDMPFYDAEHSRQRGSREKTKSSCQSRWNKETSTSEYFHCNKSTLCTSYRTYKEISSFLYITSIWLISSKFSFSLCLILCWQENEWKGRCESFLPLAKEDINFIISTITLYITFTERRLITIFVHEIVNNVSVSQKAKTFRIARILSQKLSG